MSGDAERYCCEKQFLYEIETPGVLYLTLDDDGPIYVDFKHKLKLEICRAVNNGQLNETCAKFDLTKTLHVSVIKKPSLFKEEVLPGKPTATGSRLRTFSLTQGLALQNSGSSSSLALSKKGTSNILMHFPVGNAALLGKRSQTQGLKPLSSIPSVLTSAKNADLKTEISSLDGTFSHFGKRLRTLPAQEPPFPNAQAFSKNPEPEKNVLSSSDRSTYSVVKRQKTLPCSSGRSTGFLVTRQKTLPLTQELKSASPVSSAFVTAPGTIYPEENDHDEIYTGSPVSPYSGLKTVNKSLQRNLKNQPHRSNELQLKAKKSIKPLPSAEKKMVEFQRIIEKERQKLLMLKESKITSVVLTKKQLDRLMSTSKNKNEVDGEASQPTKDATNSTLAKETFESEGGKVKQGVPSINSELENPVHCKYCGKDFSTQKAFEKHRKFTIDNYHVCLRCNTAFPYRAYLLVHLKYHNVKDSILRYKCDTCDFESLNLSELKRHTLIHTGEHCYKCCRCTKTFSNHKMLMRHLTTHRQKGHFRCSCCNQVFSSRMALVEHKLSVQKLQCGLCNQVFPNVASRSVHYKSEHKDTILRCQTCGRMYSTQKELDRHQKEHKKPKTMCPICGKLVLVLKSHMRSHKSVEEMPDSELFMCDQCPKKFKTFSDLKEHSRIHTLDKIKCHLCPASFFNQNAFSRHLNNVHCSLMPYQCEICGKRCKQRYNLAVHMRIHSEIKKFPCNLCGQAFNYKSSLQGHLRSKHSLEVTPGTDISSIGKSPSTSSVASGSCSDPPSCSKPVEVSNSVNQAIAESLQELASVDKSSTLSAAATENGISNDVKVLKPMCDDSTSTFSLDISGLATNLDTYDMLTEDVKSPHL